MSAVVEKTDFRMNKFEFFALALFALFIVLFGLFPNLLFTYINTAFVQFQAIGALQ